MKLKVSLLILLLFVCVFGVACTPVDNTGRNIDSAIVEESRVEPVGEQPEFVFTDYLPDFLDIKRNDFIDFDGDGLMERIIIYEVEYYRDREFSDLKTRTESVIVFFWRNNEWQRFPLIEVNNIAYEECFSNGDCDSYDAYDFTDFTVTDIGNDGWQELFYRVYAGEGDDKKLWNYAVLYFDDKDSMANLSGTELAKNGLRLLGGGDTSLKSVSIVDGKLIEKRGDKAVEYSVDGGVWNVELINN